MKKKLKIAYVHMSFVYSGGGEKLVIKEVERPDQGKKGYR